MAVNPEVFNRTAHPYIQEVPRPRPEAKTEHGVETVDHHGNPLDMVILNKIEVPGRFPEERIEAMIVEGILPARFGMWTEGWSGPETAVIRTTTQPYPGNPDQRVSVRYQTDEFARQQNPKVGLQSEGAPAPRVRVIADFFAKHGMNLKPLPKNHPDLMSLMTDPSPRGAEFRTGEISRQVHGGFAISEYQRNQERQARAALKAQMSAPIDQTAEVQKIVPLPFALNDHPQPKPVA